LKAITTAFPAVLPFTNRTWSDESLVITPNFFGSLCRVNNKVRTPKAPTTSRESQRPRKLQVSDGKHEASPAYIRPGFFLCSSPFSVSFVPSVLIVIPLRPCRSPIILIVLSLFSLFYSCRSCRDRFYHFHHSRRCFLFTFCSSSP